MTPTSDSNVIMHPDGRVTPIAPKDGKAYSLSELQSFVGGYIALVPLASGHYAVINEEGLYLDLDLNPGASRLLGTAIVGPCVIVPRRAMRSFP